MIATTNMEIDIITGLEMFPTDKLREEVIYELIDHFKDITKNLEDKK